MKKFFLIFVSILLAVSLTGCGKQENQIIGQDQATEGAEFQKISDWLSSGKEVKCEVYSPEGNVSIKAKDKKVRMDGILLGGMDEESQESEVLGSSIFDGKWMYTWSGDKGMKFEIEEMKKMNQEWQIDVDSKEYSWEDWSSEQDEAGVEFECSEARISDDVFSAPANVQFENFSEIINQVQQISDPVMEIQDNQEAKMPTFQGSQEMTQEEIEAKINEMMNNL